MALTEGLLHGLVVSITGGEEIAYQGGTISFARPFRPACRRYRRLENAIKNGVKNNWNSGIF